MVLLCRCNRVGWDRQCSRPCANLSGHNPCAAQGGIWASQGWRHSIAGVAAHALGQGLSVRAARLQPAEPNARSGGVAWGEPIPTHLSPPTRAHQQHFLGIAAAQVEGRGGGKVKVRLCGTDPAQQLQAHS